MVYSACFHFLYSGKLVILRWDIASCNCYEMSNVILSDCHERWPLACTLSFPISGVENSKLWHIIVLFFCYYAFIFFILNAISFTGRTLSLLTILKL